MYICRLNQPVGKGEAEEHWLQQPSGGPKVTGLTRWGANFSGIRFPCGCCEQPFLTTGWHNFATVPIQTQQEAAILNAVSRT
jgi:hypothetical protein